MLAKSNISARISQLKQVTAKKLEITAERVLQEYARIAFLDPRKFYNEDGSMKALHELTEDEAAALSGLDTEELFEMQGRKRVQIGTVKKLKFWNKTEALDALARYVGTIFDKDNGQKKPDVLPMTDDQVGKLITALKKK